MALSLSQQRGLGHKLQGAACSTSRPHQWSARPMARCCAFLPNKAPACSDAPPSAPRVLASSALAALAAAALIMGSPLEAQAVSGGGGISRPLSGEDFSNQDLRKLNLRKVTMRGTNFSGSNLSGVSLFSSLAEGAKFVGTNLTNADLEVANFEDADFTDAILEGAFVTGTQFKNVKIDNTDWSDVVLRKDQQIGLCKVAKGTNPVTGVDTRESLMCP